MGGHVDLNFFLILLAVLGFVPVLGLLYCLGKLKLFMCDRTIPFRAWFDRQVRNFIK